MERVKKPAWERSLDGARIRCQPGYPYGKRGIKCSLTFNEARELWEKSRGWELAHPTLDRIDPLGGYEYDNCRFIEASDNTRRNRWLNKGNGKMKGTISVRIKARIWKAISKMAEVEKRTIKSQIEKLLETSIALKSDKDIGLGRWGRGKKS
jgi:hypothetical protein